MGQSHEDEEWEKQLVDTMKNHRVDGLIVSIAKNTVSYEHFETIKKYDIPVVFFDRIPNMQNIHYVACNMASGTTQAFNFLRKLGHKTIGMINGPLNLLASKERVEGYRNALTKARLKYDPSLIISSDLTTENIYKVTEKLLSLKNKPTAIIAFNDYVVLDAVQAAKKMKLKINKDISFVSYANLPISNYSAHPPLASVEPFSYQQGHKAMVFLPRGGYFRIIHFVDGSVTAGTVDSAAIAFEGARQIGKFTKLLSTFDTKILHITLPDFHNLTLRYKQFEGALEQGNKDRIKACKSAIVF